MYSMEYDKSVMEEALALAEAAMEFGEIPVACFLVSENGTRVTSSQTLVRRRGSIAAHGELFAVLEAGDRIWSSGRLAIYTTLEPCLMCLGACAQAEIDSVFFGMRAKPDGAGTVASEIAAHVANIPKVTGGFMESEAVSLMRSFVERWPDSAAIPYVNNMLSFYDR